MQVNTRQKSIKLTKSESDRLREAGYILSNLYGISQTVGIQVNGKELGDAIGVLEQISMRFGPKEPVAK